MKKSLIGAAWVLGLSLLSVDAQMGRPPGAMGGAGPMRGTQFSPSMAKLFGANAAFSATMENHVQGSDGEMVVPGKISFDGGKSRFEMKLGDIKGPQASEQHTAHLKAMGMDEMVVISRPDTKTIYMVCPGVQAYSESAIQDPDVNKASSDFKVETTELGKETVDGHPCIKNKAVVTDSQGNQHESTVWNATDLKNFPVKIESNERGQQNTMLFKDIKLSKPAAGEFEAPAGYTKYGSMVAMMQAEMMKRMGGPNGMGAPNGMTMPPGHPGQ